VNAPSEASGGVGGGGGVHDGFQSLLLDMCGVAAALTSLKRGQLPRGAARLEISYLRPATGQPASLWSQKRV
jgi:acyl-coenzyme A thioesterase PaaI-like protein